MPPVSEESRQLRLRLKCTLLQSDLDVLFLHRLFMIELLKIKSDVGLFWCCLKSDWYMIFFFT